MININKIKYVINLKLYIKKSENVNNNLLIHLC